MITFFYFNQYEPSRENEAENETTVLDVMSLLLKRIDYAFNVPHKGDQWLDEIANSDNSEVCIVLPASSLYKKCAAVDKLKERFHLKAMFDIKNPYMGVAVSFVLYVFSRNANDEILYGVYNNTLKTRGHSKALELGILPEEYMRYLECISEYLKSGVCPADTLEFEFGRISIQMWDEKCWNPNHFKKVVMDAYQKLHSSKTEQLGNIAKVIRPRAIPGKSALVISPYNWKYPFELNTLNPGKATDCPLKKGDIVISNYNKIVLIYDEPCEEIHANQACTIVRPISNDFCAEYLFWYLNSEPVKTVLESEYISSYVVRFSTTNLKKLPVAFPEKENSYYKHIFFSENFPHSFFENNPQIAKDIRPSKDAFIFISYSTKDQDIADQTKQILETNGFSCWMAPQSIPPGSDYGKEIPTAIRDCAVFLLLLSQASQDSNWVPKELGQAIGKGKIVVPFQIDNASINDSFNFHLTNIQRISAYNRMSEAYCELVKRLFKILS